MLSISSAIVIAGTLIALSLIWIYRPHSQSTQSLQKPASQTDQSSQNSKIPPVSAQDHILGNPNAPVKLVEYSDLSCPYCKEFNPTIAQIANEYGPSGKVAWIYRSLPILMKPVGSSGIAPHPNSKTQAEALECVAELGGNKAFFAFEKIWFASFPTGGETRSATIDRAALDKTAKTVGINLEAFNSCLATGRYSAKIDSLYDAGFAAGVTGTPTTFLITPAGNPIAIVGPRSYYSLKSAIDALLTTVATTTNIKN